MSGYLLDTNAALIALVEPGALSPAVRRALTRGPNVLSVVSYWEVLLKSTKGNLDVGDPRAWWLQALDQLSAVPLPLRPDHVSKLYDLPSIHKDPFDRVLITQAMVEDIALVTTDQALERYASRSLRVIV